MADRRPQATTLTLAVNGAEAPEAIPAEVAVRFFIQSLGNPTRRDRLFETLALTWQERDAFAAALGTLPETLESHSPSPNPKIWP